VGSEAEFTAALSPGLDVIICDNGLPRFSALKAVDLLRERNLDVPLIVISGHDRAGGGGGAPQARRRRLPAYIREQSGKHFDPTIVRLFLNLIDGDPPAPSAP